MAKQNNDNQTNPFDPETLRIGLDKPPLVEMEYVGPMYKTTCSTFGAEIVDMFNTRMSIESARFCHIFPVIDRRGGVVTDVKTVMAFNAAMPGSKEIWINGRGGNSGKNGKKLITDYRPQRTASGKYGTGNEFRKIIGALAANFDDSGNVIINEPSQEQVDQDRRFRDLAYIEVDFGALMNLVLQIEDNDPFDFAVDFGYSQRKNHGHEDCLMTVSKFVGKRKTKTFKYREFDTNVMTSGIESMFGGDGRRNR